MTDPTHLRDQVQAAANELRSDLKATADMFGVEVEDPDEGSALTARMREFIDRIGEGAGETEWNPVRCCVHLAVIRGPMPLGVPLWSMNAVYCLDCLAAAEQIYRTTLAHENQCDICGKFGDDDTIEVVMAQVSMIMVGGQVCQDCLGNNATKGANMDQQDWFGDLDQKDAVGESWHKADDDLAASGMSEEEREAFWKALDPDTPVLEWHADLVAHGLSPEAAQAYIQWFAREMGNG